MHNWRAISKPVYDNAPYIQRKRADFAGEKPVIPCPCENRRCVAHKKHVFYIIKENRTATQVLADVPVAMAIQVCCSLGKNHAQPACTRQKFVLLDNFMSMRKWSADGHNWSMGGYADDYLRERRPGQQIMAAARRPMMQKVTAPSPTTKVALYGIIIAREA